MTTTQTADSAPLRVRVYLCRADFHVWISAGPHHPRLLCNCGRVERQHSGDCLERIGPPIYVNGIEVAEDVAAIAENEDVSEV